MRLVDLEAKREIVVPANKIGEVINEEALGTLGKELEKHRYGNNRRTFLTMLKAETETIIRESLIEDVYSVDFEATPYSPEMGNGWSVRVVIETDTTRYLFGYLYSLYAMYGNEEVTYLDNEREILTEAIRVNIR